ncbi:hypothetical protein AAFF_G00380800 [Aldrovandia affinis]|uniref:Angiotensinogen n=1 Tax=Aldrovandia affinis TaxID=143900 RepID=A0AAD7T929_9TELE|nr:hypothetical protein AAFF_G00380800 [Aldrovandia affinis]
MSKRCLIRPPASVDLRVIQRRNQIYDFLENPEIQSKMHKILRFFLLIVCISSVKTNRVYVHPFNLFSLDNVSCETVKAQAEKPLKTVKLTHIEPQDSMGPDIHTLKMAEEGRPSSTQHTSVLASLQNPLGLRLYHAIKKQKGTNTMFSPINAFGALVTFYLGASKHTASDLQQFLGLVKETDKVYCVSLFDGHKVLQTLRDIGSLTEETKNELRTTTWTFVSTKADVSEDFAQGTQDFSDTSYIRAVDFSQPQEAEARVNAFIQTTSPGKIKHLFKAISPESDLLFASSVYFKGNWGTAFQPEVSSQQEFWVDEKTSIKVPLLTQTGTYKYFNDKGRKCAVVKLPLSGTMHMLLVLPHEGAHLDHIEAKLSTDVISTWHKHLKEGLLEVSLPKFSVNAVSDLRTILTNMRLPNLLGPGANLKRLSSKHHFSVDQVLNQVVFKMDAGDGSENQDKTQDSGPALKFTVNRPFMVAIIEGNSGAILLLGRIANPTH